jgi:hypothetical protein
VNYFKGEYWIEADGTIWFADGDVGDYNHEGYATLCAQGELAGLVGFSFDDLEDFEERLKEEAEDAGYSDDEAVNKTGWWARDVAEYLLKKRDLNPDDCDDLVTVALGSGDAREYAMEKWGWIWCRGYWFGLKEWNEKTKKALITGVNNILDENGFFTETDETSYNKDAETGEEVDASGDINPLDQELNINCMSGTSIFTTLRKLETGEEGSGMPNTQAGPNAQLIKQDVQGQPGYYGSKLGDSAVKLFVAQLLG